VTPARSLSRISVSPSLTGVHHLFIGSTMPKPKLGLPPLPPRSTLPHYIPNKSFCINSGTQERDYPGRAGIVNPRLADEFVRALGVRDGEFVLEMYPGVGGITRALLSGGRSASPLLQARQKAAWWNELKDQAPETPANARKPVVPKDVFPNWIETFKNAEAEVAALEEEHKGEEEDEAKVTKPKHIVVAEPNTRIRKPCFALDPLAQPTSHQTWEYVLAQRQHSQEWLDGIHPCSVDDRITVTGADPYTWETAEYMLSHPVNQPHIPVWDPNAPPGPAQHYRNWSDPEPHITYVASMPLSSVSESLIGQWLGSAVGAADGYPTWIWRWGRVRMAFLMSRWSYDVRLLCCASIAPRVTADVSA